LEIIDGKIGGLWRPTYLKSTNHDLKILISIVEGGVAKANYYAIVDPEHVLAAQCINISARWSLFNG
jgi:hypothetical protein